MSSRQKGILFIVLSALSFAMMNLFVRLSGDLPSVQKSFFRNFVAMIFAFLLIWKSGFPKFTIDALGKRYLLYRSLLGTVGILCNFYAVDHLLLSDASMLNKMSPFFAVLFGIFILKEKINLVQLSSILVAFIGVLFVVRPTGSQLELFPSLIGLAGGICAGAAYTYVRACGNRGVPGTFIVLFFSGFSCLVTLPYLLFNYHPMTLSQLGILLLAGLGAAGGQFAITAAYYHAPAREISVYDYAQIPFSALLGFLVFAQLPDLFSWLGYGIIFSTAIAMYLYGNHKERVAKNLAHSNTL